MSVRLYRFLAWLLPRVPLGWCYQGAEALGDLLWLVARKTRANIEQNQRRALGPEAGSRAVALSSRVVLRNLAKIYVDEFRAPALSDEQLLQSLTFEGLEHLEEALRLRRGAILVSAHYGSPHILGHALAVQGYLVVAAAEHLEPEEVFQFFCKIRSSHGVRLIPVDGPLLPLVRTLKREGGIVALAADTDVTGNGLRLPFFGEETRVPAGPARLALRTGAPLLTTYCVRRGWRYVAVIEPPLWLSETPNEIDEAVREGTARVISRLESFIRSAPSEWVMTVPVWDGRNAQGEVSPPCT